MFLGSRHIPVFLNEEIKELDPKAGETALDATLGGGGHAEKLLSKVRTNGRLIVVDFDPEAIERFRSKHKQKNVVEIEGNFKDLESLTAERGIEKADVILFDFGLSSDQLDDPKRGFSFQKSGPLDMRLNREQGVTAANIVNNFSERELVLIIREYGEEKNAKKIAKGIVEARRIKLFETTDELFELIKRALPANLRFKAGDVARRTFQALRITVNDELKNIDKGIKAAFKILSPGGRMAAISFHSLEDRIVKKYFLDLAKDCVCPPEFPVCKCDRKAEAIILTPKAIRPTEEEIKINPRSNSAKLRAVRKL